MRNVKKAHEATRILAGVISDAKWTKSLLEQIIETEKAEGPATTPEEYPDAANSILSAKHAVFGWLEWNGIDKEYFAKCWAALFEGWISVRENCIQAHDSVEKEWFEFDRYATQLIRSNRLYVSCAPDAATSLKRAEEAVQEHRRIMNWNMCEFSNESLGRLLGRWVRSERDKHVSSSATANEEWLEFARWIEDLNEAEKKSKGAGLT